MPDPASVRWPWWSPRVGAVTAYAVAAAVLAAGVLLFVAAMVARRLLAPRVAGSAGRTTYESGVDPIGAGWAQTNVRYLVYAFLYVIFAVDAVYLFPWALIARSELGVASLLEVAIFVGIILIGLVHAARRGLLRWL